MIIESPPPPKENAQYTPQEASAIILEAETAGADKGSIMALRRHWVETKLVPVSDVRLRHILQRARQGEELPLKWGRTGRPQDLTSHGVQAVGDQLMNENSGGNVSVIDWQNAVLAVHKLKAQERGVHPEMMAKKQVSRNTAKRYQMLYLELTRDKYAATGGGKSDD